MPVEDGAYADFQRLDEVAELRAFVEEVECSSHEKMTKAGVNAHGMKHLALNRYSNIVPFDHSLAPCSLGYVNASIVDFPETSTSYVVAAGPMCPEEYGPETRDRFWAAAKENKVCIMVGLAPFQPGFSGCANYLRPSVHYPFLRQLGSEIRSPNSSYTKRVFDLGQGEVTHYEFHQWPNYSVANSVHELAALVQEVDTEWKTRHNYGGRVMVNCSGGIGRSGTFVAILQTYVAISKTRPPVMRNRMIFNNVVKLRLARHPWMVEGRAQYELVGRVLEVLLG